MPTRQLKKKKLDADSQPTISRFFQKILPFWVHSFLCLPVFFLSLSISFFLSLSLSFEATLQSLCTEVI